MRGVRSATGRIFELVPTLVHRDDGPPVPVASASEQARLGDARRGCGLAARCLHGTAPPGMARQTDDNKHVTTAIESSTQGQTELRGRDTN